MRLLALYLSLSLILMAKLSYAECKIIEHEGSIEVVCIGEESLASKKYKGQELASNNKNTEEERIKEQKLELDREDQRCKLEYDVCYSNCTDPKTGMICLKRCEYTQAQCKLSALNSLSPESKIKCNKRCKLEYDVCYSDCTDPKTGMICLKRCESTQAQCKMQCL